MRVSELLTTHGRSAFGLDPENYDRARPDYPARVFEVLRDRCGLGPGASVFEVGAGTGIATRRLLEVGASRVVAIEPDARLAAVLESKSRDPRLEVIVAPFEDVELPPASFDLGTAATSFHWLEQRPALAKVATLLRPGGWWAMWWNVFGDPEREDPYHEATRDLLSGLATSPSFQPNEIPFALDAQARIADLNSSGAFVDTTVEILRWTLVLDPAQVRALYATYSHIGVLGEDERARLLDGLRDIAAVQFAGRVERNMCTAIYTARRL